MKCLWGEPVGLMPEADGTYRVYYANLPLARFDPATCKLSLHNNNRGKDKNKNFPKKEKLSDMCPV